jgi:hypothetical protein
MTRQKVGYRGNGNLGCALVDPPRPLGAVEDHLVGLRLGHADVLGEVVGNRSTVYSVMSMLAGLTYFSSNG